MAPIVPYLTDSPDQLDATVRRSPGRRGLVSPIVAAPASRRARVVAGLAARAPPDLLPRYAACTAAAPTPPRPTRSASASRSGSWRPDTASPAANVTAPLPRAPKRRLPPPRSSSPCCDTGPADALTPPRPANTTNRFARLLGTARQPHMHAGFALSGRGRQTRRRPRPRPRAAGRAEASAAPGPAAFPPAAVGCIARGRSHAAVGPSKASLVSWETRCVPEFRAVVRYAEPSPAAPPLPVAPCAPRPAEAPRRGSVGGGRSGGFGVEFGGLGDHVDQRAVAQHGDLACGGRSPRRTSAAAATARR